MLSRCSAILRIARTVKGTGDNSTPVMRKGPIALDREESPTPDKGYYRVYIPSDHDAIMRSMNSTSTTGRPQLVLVETQPWFAAAPTSALERRHELEDERSRLLALAVGDHLPVELAIRAADITAHLQHTP